MVSDFDVRSCSRRCATSEQIIQPGEVYYSVLQLQGAETVRLDYRADSWQTPPEDALGWWRSRLPTRSGTKTQLAPRDVLVNLLERLAEVPEEVDFRYVLALVLMRRRIVRLESSTTDSNGCQWLSLHCPHRETDLEVQVSKPEEQHALQLQQRLVELLYADEDGEDKG